jgi:hypothetical protein
LSRACGARRSARGACVAVDHVVGATTPAIDRGNGWLVQSSGYGVALAPFNGWYRSSFAWARRPLAEAGLG